MNYQIVEQIGGKEFRPTALIYNCPKKAAAEAQRLTKIKGIKFQPRPMIEVAHTWKEREQKRFADGAYKAVCWVGHEWWDKNHNRDHFVHVSVKDPTRIAFTKSDKDGSADIQTAMKPGKYLAEFFKEILTTEQIKTFAMQHSTTFETKELKFATTSEDIQRVYKPELGHSCFSVTTKANLYGSGDFAVAYIESNDGEIKARAVCCPERKIAARSYGDSARIDKLLADAGYKTSDYGYRDSSKWRGLRLLTAHYWPGFYTDFGGCTEPHPTEPDKYLIIT